MRREGRWQRRWEMPSWDPKLELVPAEGGSLAAGDHCSSLLAEEDHSYREIEHVSC